MNYDDELMLNKWQKNTKEVLQLVFFFFKSAWASVTILGSKLIFWGKNLWNKTLNEKEENIMVGIIKPGF